MRADEGPSNLGAEDVYRYRSDYRLRVQVHTPYTYSGSEKCGWEDDGEGKPEPEEKELGKGRKTEIDFSPGHGLGPLILSSPHNTYSSHE